MTDTLEKLAKQLTDRLHARLDCDQTEDGAYILILSALRTAAEAENARCKAELDKLRETKGEIYDRFARVGAGADEINQASGALDGVFDAIAAIRPPKPKEG